MKKLLALLMVLCLCMFVVGCGPTEDPVTPEGNGGDPVTEPETDPVSEPETDPVTEPETDPVTKPTGEPTIEPPVLPDPDISVDPPATDELKVPDPDAPLELDP